MAENKVVNTTQLEADLTSIANAIRAKAGSSDSFVFPNGFTDAIANIVTGGGLPFNISSIAGGTITPAGTETRLTLTHNLGVKPNFYLIRVQGDLTTNKKVMCTMGCELGGKSQHVQICRSTNGYSTNLQQTSVFTSSAELYTQDWSSYTYASGETYHWICAKIEEQ